MRLQATGPECPLSQTFSYGHQPPMAPAALRRALGHRNYRRSSSYAAVMTWSVSPMIPFSSAGLTLKGSVVNSAR